MKPAANYRLVLCLTLGLMTEPVANAFAATSLEMDFITHAAFFSAETKQKDAIDPQVFVADDMAKAATGPQGIKHDACVRPAMIDRDAKTSALLNAQHKPLGLNLDGWLSASGHVTISDRDGKVRLEAVFKGLQPNASYSL